MNTNFCPYEPAPNDQQQDLWELLPVRAFESECQRSLEMIELCQRYMAHLVADKEDSDSRELRQSLDDLGTAAGRLDRNFSMLSALLRCAQQAEQPQWEPVELCAFARTLCAEQNSIQQKLHIQLELDCGGLTELYVDADIGYLTTICLQLLSNALRACIPDGGHITLSVRARPEGGALFSVADDGCGLPDGTLRSQQNNRSRFLGTTKCGLLLCQAYCRLTGWTLELTARPGGSGTVARLTLPQREGFASSPTLRSVTPEDTLYAARQLWMALAAELACVPGMEGTHFQIPAELT